MQTRGVQFVLDVKGDADRKVAALAASSATLTVASKKAETSTKGLTKEIGSLKEATEKLRLGAVSRGIGMVQGAMASLANPTGAVTVAIGGLAMASLAGAAGLIKLTTSAKGWLDELREAGRAENLISPEQIRDVEQMDAAFADLGIELKRLAVIVAADLAPAVTGVVARMVEWLNASERLVSSIDWTGFFAGMVLGFGNIHAKIKGLKILSDSWLKILEKIGVLTGTDSAFKVDPNRSKMGDALAGVAGGVSAPPRTSGGGSAQKPVFVKIDTSEEDAEQAQDRRELQEQGQALQSMQRSLLSMVAQQEQIEEAIRGTSGGVVFGLVKGAIGLLTGLDESVRSAANFLITLPEKIGEGIEKTLLKVLPKMLERLPEMLAGALKLPFVIGRALLLAIPKMIMGLVKGFAEAISEALEFLRGGADRNILTGEKGKWFGTSFRRGEASFLGIDFSRDEGGKRRVSEGGGRARMMGGFIERTGAYYLHAGERVVPPTGASTSAAMSAMRGGKGGGGPVNVTIGTVIGRDAREIARWIRRELGDYGTGASLTARG